MLNLSSATIRNEMAELEKIGLLEKEHTSSGRIPSDMGYKYYISNLMDAKKISGEDMLMLQSVFYNKSLELHDCINKSLEIVADLTNCATVKLGKASSINKLKEIRMLPLDDERLVIIMVTDQGFIESKNIVVKDYNLDEMEKIIAVINKMIVGIPLDNILKTLEKDVKPIIKDVVSNYKDVYLAFYKAFENFAQATKDVHGRKNILKIPEFKNDTKRVLNILEKLEDIDDVYTVDLNDSDIKIYIGDETDIDKDVTIVRSYYNTPLEKGYIDLVGPKRMDYERILTIIEYIKENIEKRR